MNEIQCGLNAIDKTMEFQLDITLVFPGELRIDFGRNKKPVG